MKTNNPLLLYCIWINLYLFWTLDHWLTYIACGYVGIWVWVRLFLSFVCVCVLVYEYMCGGMHLWRLQIDTVSLLITLHLSY